MGVVFKDYKGLDPCLVCPTGPGPVTSDHPDALIHEVRFPPAREGHRMVGSGLFVVNPPYGLGPDLKPLAARFRTLR